MGTANLPLDNAAKLYPAKACADDTCVYRVYAILTEAVRPEILQKSVLDLKPRFPTFYVRLCSGYRWNYYRPNRRDLIVRPEDGGICGLLNGRRNNGYLFSVQYDRRRITVEAFHALGDGYAAIAYLNALVYRYLTLLGHEIDPMGRVATCEQQPDEAETEDSYLKYYTGAERRAVEGDGAYQIHGAPFPSSAMCCVIHGVTDSPKLVSAAHRYQTTVTKYLTALLISSIRLAGRGDAESGRRPICVNIPINMRKLLPSRSLRNFTLYFTVCLAAMETPPPFEQIAQQVGREFDRNVRLPALQRLLNANVAVEKNRLIACLPLFVKHIAIDLVSRSIGRGRLTSSLSNLGEVDLPDGMTRFVERYGVIPPLGTDMPLAVTVISCCGRTEITFIRRIQETDVERIFFSELVRCGVPVTITTNMTESSCEVR
jgi:hypothetical protein